MADFVHAGAHQGALVGDQHDVLVAEHLGGAHQRAVALVDHHADHALGAPTLGGELAQIGALAVAVLGRGQHLPAFLRHHQGDHFLAFGHFHATHPAGGAAHHPDLGFLEADHFAVAGHQHHVFVALGNGHVDQVLAFLQTHGDQAVAARLGELGQLGAFDHAVGDRHEDERPFGGLRLAVGALGFHVFHHLGGFAVDGRRVGVGLVLVIAAGALADHFRVQTQNGGDAFLRLERRNQVDDRLAAGGAAALGQLEHAQPVNLAFIGEAQKGVVGAGHQQLLDIVLVLQLAGGLAAPAALLRAVGVDRLGLGVAGMAERDHHGFLGDQVFHAQVQPRGLDFRAALVAVLRTDRVQLVADHLHQAVRVGQDQHHFADLVQQHLVVGDQFFPFQAGQFLQAQIENRLGLLRAQVVEVVAQPVVLIETVRAGGVFAAGALQHGQYVARRPALGKQFFLRLGGARRALDQFDHRVDVGQRHRQTFQQVGLFAGLAQLVHGAAGHHLAAVTQEGVQQLAQIQGARLAVHQRHGVDAEHGLHLRLLIEVVEHHFRVLAPAQLDIDPHALLVGFVAQLGDALDLLFLDQLGDFLDQPGLVHLIGQLVNDDGFLATLVGLLDLGAGTDINAAPAGAVSLHDPGTAVDDAGGGEIRTLDVFHQVVRRQAVVVDQRQAAVDHLAHVVGRDIGGHAHGDAGGAVDQQVGHPRRHDVGNALGAVVVVHIVDGFLVQIGQQLVGDLGHAHFGVTHGGGGVAVDGTEVALPVHQHVAQGERLGHADNGVVHSGIAVGVIFTNYITHHTGGLFIGFIPVVAELVHGEQHAAVHRLEAVAHIRQSPAHDHAHGVIQVRLSEFVLDVDGSNFFGEVRHGVPYIPRWRG